MTTVGVLAASLRARPRWPLWLAFGLLAITLALVGIREIFLGYDSIGNYAHTWYISQRLFTDHRLPLYIPFLDGGHGLALPYGALPWTVGAILFHFLANRAVTLMMVLATLALLWTVNLARLRFNPWLTALFVVSPMFLHEGILSFQLPFYWAAALFFSYVYLVERQRYALAFLAMGLAVYTHPFLGPIAIAVYNVVAFRSRPDQRRGLAALSVAGVIITLPMAWYIHGAPLITGRSFWFLLGRLLERIVRGEALILFPFLLVRYRRFFLHYAPAAIGIMAAANIALLVGTHNYTGLLHDSQPRYQQYFQSADFVPGATYRLLTPGQRKDGMYYFAQQGAVLANDFFSESQYRKSWEPQEYKDFLAEKQIDFVVLESDYTATERTNEEQLLQDLARQGKASIVYSDGQKGFAVFDVRLARSGTGT